MKKNKINILKDRGIISVLGKDSKEFLQNIITNDINIDDDTTHKTDLSNITVSLLDTSNLSEVTIVLSAADSVTGNDPGYTLDASGVTSFDSSYDFTVSTTSPLTIKVAGTKADGSSLEADLR